MRSDRHAMKRISLNCFFTQRASTIYTPYILRREKSERRFLKNQSKSTASYTNLPSSLPSPVEYARLRKMYRNDSGTDSQLEGFSNKIQNQDTNLPLIHVTTAVTPPYLRSPDDSINPSIAMKAKRDSKLRMIINMKRGELKQLGQNDEPLSTLEQIETGEEFKSEMGNT